MNEIKIPCFELEHITNLVFTPCGLELTKLEAELESKEYHAHDFKLAQQTIKFRVAKITPTKTGQFVTIWKRNAQGITTPFDVSDNIDLYIIATRKESNFGIFIFPKRILHTRKILSDKHRDGKRGIRVYPSWDDTTSKQATDTQRWQTEYFLNLSQQTQVDLHKAKALLQIMK